MMGADVGRAWKFPLNEREPLGKVVRDPLQQKIMVRGVRRYTLAAAAQQLPVKDSVVRRHLCSLSAPRPTIYIRLRWADEHEQPD